MSDVTERLMRFTHYQSVWQQWDDDGKQNLGDAITEGVEKIDALTARLAAAEQEVQTWKDKCGEVAAELAVMRLKHEGGC